MTELAFPANHIARVRSHANPNAPFFHESARRLADRLTDTKRSFTNILNISSDFGATQRLYLNAQTTPQPGQSYNLILANLTLSTLSDPTTTLHQHLQTLAPDGLLLATTLGSNSFHEFRHAFHAAALGVTGHITPLPDVQECGHLLQRLKLALPVVDRDLITLTFPDMPTLLRNLRAHAAHNYHPERAKGLLTPRQWHNISQAYQQQFQRPDGRLPVTIELIYLHGWQPHTSQQKPLQPGQGKVSLVKILNPA